MFISISSPFGFHSMNPKFEKETFKMSKQSLTFSNNRFQFIPRSPIPANYPICRLQ